ncbi:hypothetical protein CIG75_16110 [Tumebacillus algifaecis]|uniref:Uncharacterized protein n=1 Tax=Tumebacillus algifaecis TaxID=1214604 RepID=A0A223D455_9BACL|nr:hypothetical protein [Tumebacillus algifaecis]ASS76320.1 hypothetical protein CIG75_16110 [Tumebacillus algifaecis]
MYMVGDFGRVLLLFALMTPVLLFVGFHLLKLAYGDREHAEPTDVVVMPPDLVWMNYTNDLDTIIEITSAVIQVRQEPPVSYAQIKPYLESYEAHKVAQLIGVFHVYREREIRHYLTTTYHKSSAQARLQQ